MSQHPGERVLVVTASFPPDGAVGGLRTLRLLNALARSGSDVEVLTLSPDTYRKGTVIDSALLSQIPERVRVTRARALRPIERLGAALRRTRAQSAHRDLREVRDTTVPSRPAGPRTRLRRLQQACTAVTTLPDREASWILPAVARGYASGRSAPPDILYSSGPPFSAHLVAACLASLLRKPWVADFRDPWARAPWRDERFQFEKRAWAILERRVVARADAVVFVTEANRAEFAAHYGAESAQRFHVVPNGCNIADFEGLTHTPSGRFVVLHAGSLYGARDPSPMFRAVADGVAGGAIDRARFRLRFIGRIGVSGVDLQALSRDLGIQDLVEFVPHMPRRMVLQEMVDASALLVVQPVTKVSVPGKLYEYLAAGRPILALAEPEGDTAALVRRSKAGIAVSPDDQCGITRALVQLMSSAADRLQTDPSLYDGAVRAAELAAVLGRTIAGRRVPGSASSAVSVPTKQS